MSCYYHPDRDSVSLCSVCGQAICTGCTYVTGTNPICRHCWDTQVVGHKEAVIPKPAKVKLPKPERKAKVQKPAEFTIEVVVTRDQPVTHYESIAPVAAVTDKETPMHQEPAPQDIQTAHTEPPALIEQVPLKEMQMHAEPPMHNLWATVYSPKAKPVTEETKTKAKRTEQGNIGTRARALLSSLAKLRPRAPAQQPAHYEPTAPAEAVPGRETPMRQEPAPQDVQIAHIESPVRVEQVPPKKMQIHAELPTHKLGATAETAPKFDQPKPKIKGEQKNKVDIGTRTRALLGALSKLKPRAGDEGPRKKGPQRVQVAQQIFLCHNCNSENTIGELFCQTCGAWFQYHCPKCGAIVDRSFKSCPGCSAELNWGI